LFLGHNFRTRNVRKSIKGSKDSDSSLLSNENLSKILPSRGWALGQVILAKMAKNLPYLWYHSQRTWNPKLKKIFHCSLEDLPSLLQGWTVL